MGGVKEQNQSSSGIERSVFGFTPAPASSLSTAGLTASAFARDSALHEQAAQNNVFGSEAIQRVLSLPGLDRIRGNALELSAHHHAHQEGDETKAVQFLFNRIAEKHHVDLGSLPEKEGDPGFGHFGPHTKASTIAFQTWYNSLNRPGEKLQVDGIVGDKTLAKMEEMLKQEKPLMKQVAAADVAKGSHPEFGFGAQFQMGFFDSTLHDKAFFLQKRGFEVAQAENQDLLIRKPGEAKWHKAETGGTLAGGFTHGAAVAGVTFAVDAGVEAASLGWATPALVATSGAAAGTTETAIEAWGVAAGAREKLSATQIGIATAGGVIVRVPLATKVIPCADGTLIPVGS